MFLHILILCPCSTGRRCHGARTAYEKMNRYAARSPRRFGGTSLALLFRMCCVSTAYLWRMNGDATAYDVAYENLTIGYSRRKWRMHSVHPTRAAVNAILWRVAGACTAHGLRTCRTYQYTSLYMSCECDI